MIGPCTVAPRGSDGITVLEILIVGALIAVVGALVIPGTLKRIPYYRLDNAVASLVSQLRAARMQAISEGLPVVTVIDVSQKTLAVMVDRDNNGAYAASETKTIPIGPSDALSISAADTNGTFSPRGTFSAPSGSWKIAVDGGAAGRQYVYVFAGGQVDRSEESF